MDEKTEKLLREMRAFRSTAMGATLGDPNTRVDNLLENYVKRSNVLLNALAPATQPFEG